MKTALFTTFTLLLVVIILFSCDYEKEPEVTNSSIGCLTGIPLGGSDRIFIRCCTRWEYVNGNDTNQGGTPNWNDYTNHQWALVTDCSECH